MRVVAPSRPSPAADSDGRSRGRARVSGSAAPGAPRAWLRSASSPSSSQWPSKPSCGQRLGLDEVLLVDGAPFRGGDGDRDERHRLALLTLEVREQHLAEASQRGEQRDSRLVGCPRCRSRGRRVSQASTNGATRAWSASMASSSGVASGLRSRTSGHSPASSPWWWASRKPIIQATCSPIAIRWACSGYGAVESTSMARPRSRRSASWTMPIIRVSAGAFGIRVMASPSLPAATDGRSSLPATPRSAPRSTPPGPPAAGRPPCSALPTTRRARCR